ncbi:ATP-binding protein [Aulosira sp. FACHB-615]|uniref:nSTAND1 domain-containing NTPase n=1 Tax=Aulosira sp. FACHB-615 TaxID=2692777 RepID=UPI0016823687|nr:ATP-binding protein [Aulosira sp. FACHB-615]MBD2487161.1 caspase family protein [Aulosira sp. FACHB-615]
MARYALVVGITDYKIPLKNLSKPATDAEAVAQVLQAYGDFEDIKLLKGNVTKQQLGDALKILLRRQAVNHEAIIYFTGHGITVSDLELETQQAYLATSDLKIVTQGDTIVEQTSGISLINLNQLITESHLSSLVVLLDCCHSGHFLERHLIEKTLTAFSSQRDYYFIAACRDFQQAYAKKNEQHSIFTTALLRGLSAENANDNGQVTGDRIFDMIASELKGSGQEPIRMGWGRSINLVKYPPKQTTAVIDETCPYQGLRPFGKEQARFFFGRYQVIQQLIKKLSQANFVPIIGASGSGKSSVVRAGLIPVLEKNGWRVLEPILPGVEPLAELKRAFTQLFGRTEIREIAALIDTAGLSAVISRLTSSERCLLVVDQFEEIFTLGAREEERQLCIELLTQVSQGRLAIVTTMRADFLEYCLSYESLTQIIQEQAVYMPPLLGAELEEAIVCPAILQGYQLERGLLGAIQQEVLGQEKGCLPLLQFALTELWEHRGQKNHQLTLAKFNELGGVIGALNRHADKLYASFTEKQQGWIKQIFLKLLRTGTEDKDTRQRQLKNQLLLSIARENPSTQEAISDVLEKLIQSRLLVCDTEDTGEIWIDLAHEALMEGWKLFDEWRKENRPLRRLILLVEDAYEEWMKNPQDENLMMGRLLAQVQKSWAELESSVSPSVAVFCQLSIDAELNHKQNAELTNRVKDEFLAVLSHELRTPLNPILGWTQLLRSGRLDSEKVERALETIERNAKLEMQLIDDLLDLSRTLRGEMILNISVVDLVTTIKTALEKVRLAAEAKSIQIQTKFGNEPILVMGDRDRLQQVIWNLITNAVKFTPYEGQVEVLLDKVERYAQIQVIDTGLGIKAEFLPHVFEYFRQEDSQQQRAFGGLGIGLAIVRYLVELHGGTIQAESPGKGQGATFTVQLPLHKNPENQVLISKPNVAELDNQDTLLAGVQILLVDDEADVRDFFSYVLEKYGATITTVASAAEALEFLARSKPDVLLSDVEGPLNIGDMLIQEIRKWPPENGGQIPAIALTSYTEYIDQNQARTTDFQKHISKAAEPSELAKAIAQLIGQK